MRTTRNILWGIVIGVLVFGVLAAIMTHPGLAIDIDYLLTVVTAAGALGGIAFALYGWFTARELPKRIEDEVAEAVAKIRSELQEQWVRQQEAMQKVIAAYALGGAHQADRKIELIQSALALDETVYNGYVTLGYTYWHDKGDTLKAAECFMRDLEVHPNNYQAACDLVALHTSQQEWVSALTWMKRALRLNSRCWEALQTDSRLDSLRSAKPHEFTQLIDEARRQPGTT